MRSLAGIALALLVVPVAAEEKGVDHWISLLEVGNVAERRQSAYEIWKLKERGKRAAPALAYALRDQDDYVRETAAKALESMIWGAVDALLPLEKALADERVAVRRDAAKLLAMVGPEAFDALDSLRAALRDADAEVRRHAVSVFSHFGPNASAAAPDVGRLLKEDPDGNVRSWAANALFVMGTPPSSVPALLAALEDKDPAVKERAVGALQVLWPEVKIPVATLLAMLEHESASARAAAAMGLRRHLDDPDVRDALVAAADDPDPWAAGPIFESIAAMKPPPETGVAAVAARLRAPATDERTAGLRSHAVFALLRMGPAAAPALPALVDSLGSGNETVLLLWTLGEIGPAAKAAVPAIRKRLADEDARTAFAAAGALLRIEGEALETLTAALGDPARAKAALAELGQLGPAGAGAAPAARELLGDDGLSRNAAVALYRIAGAEEKEAYAIVLESIRKGDDTWCRIATLALRDRPSPDEAAVAALVEVLKTREDGIRYHAAEALRNLGPVARPALPTLREALAGARPPVNVAIKEAIVAAR